jgi:uncharacterized membrane protein YedE/YeeE
MDFANSKCKINCNNDFFQSFMGAVVPDIALTSIVGAGAFALAFAFGAVTQATGFCTMGAVADLVLVGDWRRFRAWMLALAVAMAGSQGLAAAGWIDLGRSSYLSGGIPLAGAILGGVAFGIGMVLAGGCGAKTLVRLGGGNLKSLVVVLVVGLTAMATIKGVLAPLRLALDRATTVPLKATGLATPSFPAVLEKLGLEPDPARWLPVAVIGGGLILWCFKDAAFRRSSRHWGSGLAVGALICAGWAVTGVLGDDPFEPVALASFSFIGPIGDSLIYLMTYTGATLTFGIASVAGVVAGAFAAARTRREFRLETFTDPDDLARHLTGAVLMGLGGVLAMGCTIGQGLSGFSTLSLASPLALGGILLGGLIGLKRLEEGCFTAALASLLKHR